MLSLESCPSTQSTWCKTTKKGIYLHLHLSRSAPTSWTANYLDRKTLNWTWQSVTSLNQPSLMDSSAIHLTLQSLEDHQLEKVEQVPCSSSTLLYHVSLWYLGAETGYRVVTPYRRRENINGATEAKIDQFGPVFFAKSGFSYGFGELLFFGPHFHFLGR